MFTSIPSLDTVLQCLLPVFTQPSYQTHVEVLLPKALAAKERRTDRQGEDERSQGEERMALREIESLVRPLMEGVERRFCEKCWRDLQAEGSPEGVVVVHRGPGGISGEPGGR